jgi:hypothetical protein
MPVAGDVSRESGRLKADNKTNPIKLVKQAGSDSIYIDVRITEDGDLLFSGQDRAVRRRRPSAIRNTSIG